MHVILLLQCNSVPSTHTNPHEAAFKTTCQMHALCWQLGTYSYVQEVAGPNMLQETTQLFTSMRGRMFCATEHSLRVCCSTTLGS